MAPYISRTQQAIPLVRMGWLPWSDIANRVVPPSCFHAP